MLFPHEFQIAATSGIFGVNLASLVASVNALNKSPSAFQKSPYVASAILSETAVLLLISSVNILILLFV